MNYIQITKQELDFTVIEMTPDGEELFRIGRWNTLEKSVERAHQFIDLIKDLLEEDTISNELKIV